MSCWISQARGNEREFYIIEEKVQKKGLEENIIQIKTVNLQQDLKIT